MTNRCGVTHLLYRNFSHQFPQNANLNRSEPDLSRPSIYSPQRAKLAALSTPILSSGLSVRSNGPFSCTSTSIITYRSSVFDGSRPCNWPRQGQPWLDRDGSRLLEMDYMLPDLVVIRRARDHEGNHGTGMISLEKGNQRLQQQVISPPVALVGGRKNEVLSPNFYCKSLLSFRVRE